MYSIAILVLLTALCLVLDDVEWSLKGGEVMTPIGTVMLSVVLFIAWKALRALIERWWGKR